MTKGGWVYIMTNKTHSVLYIGVTAQLVTRVYDHKNKTYPKSFTAKYNCDKLVYYSDFSSIEEAIAAEKYLKGKIRQHKINLINELNPGWKDLYDDLIGE
jgi:putative endonuclease